MRPKQWRARAARVLVARMCSTYSYVHRTQLVFQRCWMHLISCAVRDAHVHEYCQAKLLLTSAALSICIWTGRATPSQQLFGMHACMWHRGPVHKCTRGTPSWAPLAMTERSYSVTESSNSNSYPQCFATTPASDGRSNMPIAIANTSRIHAATGRGIQGPARQRRPRSCSCRSYVATCVAPLSYCTVVQPVQGRVRALTYAPPCARGNQCSPIDRASSSGSLAPVGH